MSSPLLTSRAFLKQAQTLIPDPETRDRFVEAVTAGTSSQPSLIWLTEKPTEVPFSLHRLTNWQPDWVETMTEQVNIGSFDIYKNGDCYPLDFSSIFSISALLAIPAKPETILDLCAAPGGKSIFAWRHFKPELLIANEVIGKRSGALVSNLKRCHIEGSAVTGLDSQVFANRYPESFELILVDAPCSGQSLPAKGQEALGAYHPQLINMNANRQKRIMANAAQAVAPGGHIAYMTCTYSREENERVVEWILKKNPELEAVEVPHLAAHRSALTETPCYRLWPHEGLGAGAFTALLRRKAGPNHARDISNLPTTWQYPSVDEQQ